MSFLELQEAAASLVGSRVAKPKGTLAGHAAGLPFEGVVHERLTRIFEGRAFRQFEFLNRIMISSTEATLNETIQRLGPPSLQLLLSRGASALSSWSPENQFVEKQNDTAETIIQSNQHYVSGDPLTFLDVKTHNLNLKGQPPNIVSAEKLAHSLHAALQEGKVLFDFVYLGIDWVIEDEYLVAQSSRAISMFKIKKMPYINWTAAQQVQFHVGKVDQEFSGSAEEWAEQYLGHVWKSLIASQDTKRGRFREFEMYAKS